MTTSVAAERDRSAIEDKYKWNLADLYPTVQQWRASKDRIAADVASLRAWRGT